MKELPVTKFFDDNKLIGRIEIANEAYEQFKQNPEKFTFGIGFIGKPQEDGTYTEVELIEVSMIHRERESHGNGI